MWQNLGMKVIVSRTLKRIVKLQYKNNALYVMANVLISRGKIKKIIAENAEWIRDQKQSGNNSALRNNKQFTECDNDRQSQQKPKQNLQKQDKRIADKAYIIEQQQLVKEIFAGRKTMILGDVVSVAPSLSGKTYLDGSTLYMAEKSYNDREQRIKAIKTYLKKIAFLFVASEVSAFGSSVSLCPQKIEFKDIGDCWCKCSLAAQKILCFDYRLTQLPQNYRNYVIAHAFAHFHFATHDDAFYSHLSNVIPHYEDVANQIEMFDFLKDI